METAGAVTVFDRFTDASRQVVCLACEESGLLRSRLIGTGHLLLGLLREGHGVGAQALAAHGIELETARAVVSRVHRSVAGPASGTS